MAENSKIEWCDHTFNPWRGCTKVSAGCDNCYAETLSKRNPAVLGVWGPNGTRVVAAESQWKAVEKWNANAAESGRRARVFCASLADVFEDFSGNMTTPGAPGPSPVSGPMETRYRLLSTIRRTPYLDWLVLTKRPENVLRMLAACAAINDSTPTSRWLREWLNGKPPANVWIGTSVENQAAADERIPHLLRIPACVRFLSCEPLLGPLELQFHPDECPTCGGPISGLRNNAAEPFQWFCSRKRCEDNYSLPRIDWVIAGGESGPHARPMHPEWARSLRDQCQAAGVPYFFKQWGEWSPQYSFDHRAVNVDPINGAFAYPGKHLGPKGLPIQGPNTMFRIGKKAAGRAFDGREWSEFPQVSTK